MPWANPAVTNCDLKTKLKYKLSLKYKHFKM